MLADVSRLGVRDDHDAARVLLEQARIAVIPGSSFHADPADGRQKV